MDSLPRQAAATPDLARLLRIMWAAFVGAAVIYGVVPFVATPPGDDTLTPSIRGALYSAAAGAAVASLVTRRWWLHAIAARAEPGAGADPAGVQVRVKAGAIITWALSEVVALLGVVRAFSSHDPRYAVPFVAAALVLLYLHRPATWPVDAMPATP